jgi:hypothetical protein
MSAITSAGHSAKAVSTAITSLVLGTVGSSIASPAWASLDSKRIACQRSRSRSRAAACSSTSRRRRGVQKRRTNRIRSRVRIEAHAVRLFCRREIRAFVKILTPLMTAAFRKARPTANLKPPLRIGLIPVSCLNASMTDARLARRVPRRRDRGDSVSVRFSAADRSCRLGRHGESRPQGVSTRRRVSLFTVAIFFTAH